MTRDATASTDIFREWDLYDRIGQANYMRHREIAQAIRDTIPDAGLPWRVVDLGCGDGYVSHLVLANWTVGQFVGIDLSASAIERLGRRTPPGQRPESVDRRLIAGDMATELERLPPSAFDLVHASFSLHHYRQTAKPGALAEIARILDRGGYFVWTDVVRREGEAPRAFIQRLADSIHADWHDIPRADRKAVADHMFEADHPETEAWAVGSTEAVGLALIGRAYQDEFYTTLVFQKPA